jgi:glucose/arabinose dehydrogenase
MVKPIALLPILVSVLLAACQSNPQTTASPSTRASTSTSAGASPSVRLFVNANDPTALGWAADGRLFYAERQGSIRTFDGKSSKLFATVSVSTDGERGLLGLAISPSFTQDHYVYAFYSRADDESRQRVVRWTDNNGTGTKLTVLIDNLPAGSDCCHKGGRLAFGTDGKLYVTVGENHLASQAQDPSSLRGKILRYNADGSVPADNPFGSTDPVWAIGLRNPFGLAFGPAGALFVTDNGPSGDDGSPGTGYDEVDAVERGGNYQWPICYGNGVHLHGSTCVGTPPRYQSGPTTLVPTGATFASDKAPNGYAGDFLFCSYAQDRLKVLSSDGRRLLFDGPPCRYDVKEGPDHALYLADQSGVSRLGS